MVTYVRYIDNVAFIYVNKKSDNFSKQLHPGNIPKDQSQNGVI